MATSSLSPDQQAQIEQSNANTYRGLLNQFGLDQYNLLSKTTATPTPPRRRTSRTS